MSVVIRYGSTVRSFVADEAVFTKSVDERFASLDLNGDGILSRSELRCSLEKFRLTATDSSLLDTTPPEQISALYDFIFDQFYLDGSDTVDHAEFRSEMKKILLAVANSLGASPIQTPLRLSLMESAADLEATKLAGGKRD